MVQVEVRAQHRRAALGLFEHCGQLGVAESRVAAEHNHVDALFAVQRQHPVAGSFERGVKRLAAHRLQLQRPRLPEQMDADELGRRHNMLGLRLEPHARQPRSHLLAGIRRVVGDEADTLTLAAQRLEQLARPLGDALAKVDAAVQVEENSFRLLQRRPCLLRLLCCG